MPSAIGFGPALAMVGVLLLVGAMPSFRRSGEVRGLRWILAALFLARAAALLGAFPAASAVVLVLGFGLLLPGGRNRSALVASGALVAVAVVGAGWLGADREARLEFAHARVQGGPLLGAHPRQSVALAIGSGVGPNLVFPIVLDDYVSVEEDKGYDAVAFAARLQAMLRQSAAISAPLSRPGNARLHLALARAEVGLAPAADRDATGEVLQRNALDIRSGLAGYGTSLGFVCPGRLADESPHRDNRTACPRKYASQANAGLGSSGRWPGHTERLARSPSGAQAWMSTADAEHAPISRFDRRFVWPWLLVLGLGWAASMRRREPPHSLVGAGAVLGLVGMGAFAFAAMAWGPPWFDGTAWAGARASGAGQAMGQAMGLGVGGIFGSDALQGVGAVGLAAWVWPRERASVRAGWVSRWLWLGPLALLLFLSAAWLAIAHVDLWPAAIPTRGTASAWIVVLSDLAARQLGEPGWVASIEAISAAVGIGVCAIAAISLIEGEERASPQPSKTAFSAFVALFLLAGLCLRKPALFDALLLGAWVWGLLRLRSLAPGRRGARSAKPRNRTNPADSARKS